MQYMPWICLPASAGTLRVASGGRDDWGKGGFAAQGLSATPGQDHRLSCGWCPSLAIDPGRRGIETPSVTLPSDEIRGTPRVWPKSRELSEAKRPCYPRFRGRLGF